METVGEQSLDLEEDFEEIGDNIDIQLAPAFEEICDPKCRRESILVETGIQRLGYHGNPSLEIVEQLEEIECEESISAQETVSGITAKVTSNSDVSKIQYALGHSKNRKKLVDDFEELKEIEETDSISSTGEIVPTVMAKATSKFDQNKIQYAPEHLKKRKKLQKQTSKSGPEMYVFCIDHHENVPISVSGAYGVFTILLLLI